MATEICRNNMRRHESLLHLIPKHVYRGSIVRTDWWRAYDFKQYSKPFVSL